MQDNRLAGGIFTGVTIATLVLAGGWTGLPPTERPAPPDPDRSALQERDELRVCADPNNLPFSNREKQGFHNELAQLFADELGLSSVSYTWWPQRRGFVRNTLKKDKCDLIFGVPEGYDILQSTKPFYRSPYVFLYRKDAEFEVSSLDDPVLRELKIGVNLIGDDYMNPPPAHALGARGIVGNVQGFAVYGDYDEESPPKRIVDAVANRDVELAIVWGPVAGYWAQRHDAGFTINPLPAVDDSTGFPLAYSMSLGVRRGEDEWQARLEKVIAENHDTIYSILEKYNVPLLPLESGQAAGSGGDDADEVDDSEASTAGREGDRVPIATLASRSGEPSASANALAPVLRRAARDTTVAQRVYNGWKWFMVYCTRCHGETGTGSTIAPSLLEAVNRQTFTRDSFVHTVMNGRPEKGMPSWSQLLSEDKAGAIYEYIHARTQGLTAGRPERPEPDSAASEGGS